MNLPNRKPTRLKTYDYSTVGAYFITICTHQKRNFFGDIKNDRMLLNDLGEIVNKEILAIETHYSNVQVDKYVIMPNHIHLIVSILETERINPFPTKKTDIPNIIGKFKAGVSRVVGNAFMHSVTKSIWQRSYHDRIIRSEQEYRKIWEYVDTNVIKWDKDCFYTEQKVTD